VIGRRERPMRDYGSAESAQTTRVLMREVMGMRESSYHEAPSERIISVRERAS